MTRCGVGRQIKALVNDALYRSPAQVDIFGCAPRIGDIAYPSTGESPTADIPVYFVTCSFYCSRNILVTLLYIEVETFGIVTGIGTTIINLYEIKIGRPMVAPTM